MGQIYGEWTKEGAWNQMQGLGENTLGCFIYKNGIISSKYILQCTWKLA